MTLVGMGAVLPDVLAAADTLGPDVDVICVTSADLLFRALRARAGPGRRLRGASSTSSSQPIAPPRS